MLGVDLHPDDVTEEAPELSAEVGDWFVSGQIAADCEKRLDRAQQLLISAQTHLSGPARALREGPSPVVAGPGPRTGGVARAV